jgi:hypothetical protein
MHALTGEGDLLPSCSVPKTRLDLFVAVCSGV